MTIDDILACLRDKGFFSITQVQYAIVETSGKISVMPKAQFSSATCQDLKLQPDESFVPITLVCEGKILEDNVALAVLDKQKVEQLVKKEANAKVKDVLVLSIEKSGKGYIQLKKNKGKSFQTKGLGEG